VIKIQFYSYINFDAEFATLFFSNVAGLPTGFAEQLIPTWAKFKGKTTVLSPTKLESIMRILSVIFILTANLTFAQERQLTVDSDTSFWFNWRTELNRELGLVTIDKSIEEFELRFWDGYKVVRLWEAEDELRSEVIYFLREYKENKDSYDYEGRLYHSSQQLNEKTTQAINNLIKDFNILNLPTDNQIEGWKQGLDGVTYIIETSEPNSFSFKNYWTPTSFPELKEARFLQYFVEQINSLEQINKGFEKFMAKQPFKTYYAGIGSAVIATVIK